MKVLVTKFLAIICMTVLSSTLFNSCKKYPDGPNFSLRTKKARLCGTWVMDTYKINGVDQTAFFNAVLPGYQLEINTNETYKSSSNTGATEEGKWEFTNSKESVKTTITLTGATNENEILKLENKALWLKNKDTNNNTIELHLKAK